MATPLVEEIQSKEERRANYIFLLFICGLISISPLSIELSNVLIYLFELYNLPPIVYFAVKS